MCKIVIDGKRCPDTHLRIEVYPLGDDRYRVTSGGWMDGEKSRVVVCPPSKTIFIDIPCEMEGMVIIKR